MDEWVWSIRMMTGENRSTRRKTCSSITLPVTNPTWTGSGPSPELRGERPATTYVTYLSQFSEYNKGWTTEEFGFDSRQGQDILFSKAPRPTQSVIQYVPMALSPRIKRPEREADHSSSNHLYAVKTSTGPTWNYLNSRHASQRHFTQRLQLKCINWHIWTTGSLQSRANQT